MAVKESVGGCCGRAQQPAACQGCMCFHLVGWDEKWWHYPCHIRHWCVFPHCNLAARLWGGFLLSQENKVLQDAFLSRINVCRPFLDTGWKEQMFKCRFQVSMPVCVSLILWLGVSREEGRFSKVCLFLGWMVLLLCGWLFSWEKCLVQLVCREHFAAGLRLNMFVVDLFFRGNIRFAKGFSLEYCSGLATILLFVSRWGFKHSS